MKEKLNLFFFGFGQTAKYFVEELSNSKKKSIEILLVVVSERKKGLNKNKKA